MSGASDRIATTNKRRTNIYKVTCAYDSHAPHWSAEYENEFGAWESFFRFTDWGMANEFSTVNIMTPTGKMYTKLFYRNGEVVVK